MTNDASKSINDNLVMLLSLIPEIKPCIGFDQCHPHHIFDVWEHTLVALSYSKLDFDVRLALLLHDIAKPVCYQQDGIIRHFHGHAKASSDLSKKILQRIGFNEIIINDICYLIENHDTPITEGEIQKNINLQEKRLEVQRCDTMAHNPKFNNKRLSYLLKTQKLIDLYKTNNSN